MERKKYDDPFLESIPLERKLEIDAVLKKSAEEVKENGFTGFMTLEEFEKYMKEKFGKIQLPDWQVQLQEDFPFMKRDSVDVVKILELNPAMKTMMIKPRSGMRRSFRHMWVL